MINGLQIALKKTIDVIAPPATPLQDFTYHWKQLMNFYVNHSSDAQVLVETTSIPRHLERLLGLLLDEEKHGAEPGPCLEYLLQHRLLDLLASLACAETPPGMRLVCLSFFRRLLTRSRHPLLHHAAVYGPVQRLIAVCNGNLASPIENEEIQFLLSLCFLVCKYPHVTNVVNGTGDVLQPEEDTTMKERCKAGTNEVDRVTYVPTEKMSDNPLFRPLDAQAITLVNPDLFKSKETAKTSKHARNASTRSSESSKDAEIASQSSSPFAEKPSDDFVPTCAYDPVLAVLDDSKNARLLEEDCASSASCAGDDGKSRNHHKQRRHDLTLSPGSPEHSKSLLLDSLKSYVNSADNTIRIRACEGIMVLASLDDPLFAEIVVKSNLSSVLAKRLEVLFSVIPAHVEPGEVEDIEVTWGLDCPPLLDDKKFPGCRRVAAFFAWLDFCAQLSREAHPAVTEVLIETIRTSFFDRVLFPALAAHHAVLITALIAKCLKDARCSPLGVELARWLVGRQQTDPDIPEVWSSPVLHRLIENCRTESDDLTTETLKLFEEIIEMRDEHVLYSLVLAYLNTRDYYDNGAADSAIASWSDEEDEREREREKRGAIDISQGTSHSRTLAPSNIHRILNCWLSLLPRYLQTAPDESYGRYMGDWEKQYSAIAKNCALLAWPLEAVCATTAATTTTTTDDSASSDSRADAADGRFYAGPFLVMLLDKVADIPKQKYEINLHLTILITKLALLPHPYLHEFLLNPLIPLVSGKRSLFLCLQRVSKQLVNKVPKIADYKQLLNEARLSIFDDSPSLQDKVDNSPRDQDVLLESVIIVEEFCKELAAIAYVKYHHSM